MICFNPPQQNHRRISAGILWVTTCRIFSVMQNQPGVFKGKKQKLSAYDDLYVQFQLKHEASFCSSALKTFCSEIRKPIWEPDGLCRCWQMAADA